MKKHIGFTLIELSITIVIIGTLSTIAIPIYNDMRDQAALANVQSIGATLSTASRMNYTAKLLKP